ncbi:ATP-binding protein [Streptomyces sp. NPDC007084]|uniref:ATP-binding protein n=1 Tax=Streptomyces sp. NPDC007084 TaxID=3154313 RepID=UPI0034566099
MDESSGVAGGGRAGESPALETSLELDGDGTRIAQARQVAVAFLSKVRDTQGIPVVSAVVEVVQLIVSELVTNARKHAPGPARLRLLVTDSVLRVELWDSNPLLPAAKTADPARIGQHGLEIVTALAQSFSIERTAVGKRVTADISLGVAPAPSAL